MIHAIKNNVCLCWRSSHIIVHSLQVNFIFFSVWLENIKILLFSQALCERCHHYKRRKCSRQQISMPEIYWKWYLINQSIEHVACLLCQIVSLVLYTVCILDLERFVFSFRWLFHLQTKGRPSRPTKTWRPHCAALLPRIPGLGGASAMGVCPQCQDLLCHRHRSIWGSSPSRRGVSRCCWSRSICVVWKDRRTALLRQQEGRGAHIPAEGGGTVI